MGSKTSGHRSEITLESLPQRMNGLNQEHSSTCTTLFHSRYSSFSTGINNYSVSPLCTKDNGLLFSRRFRGHISSPISGILQSCVSGVATSRGHHGVEDFISEMSSMSDLMDPNSVRVGCESINADLGPNAVDNYNFNSQGVQAQDSSRLLLLPSPPLFKSSSSMNFIWSCITYLCLMSAFLSFLFSWMLLKQHLPFALAEVKYNWNSAVKSRACVCAGLYYLLAYFLLLAGCIRPLLSRAYRYICLLYTFIRHSFLVRFFKYYRCYLFRPNRLSIGEVDDFELKNMFQRSCEASLRTPVSTQIGLKLRGRPRIPSFR